ncbi:histidine phosphatase family protein [Nocardioides marmoribigeumensis]|uniref:Phosphomutase (TIGR03848 family) n=1 Tax=Nocardioides marmoribigeumensis TaxID=433649 RepID=A0ABU2C171_9ACTN|nr:histidine phosphatase family protein [Nocardioides marmoribigeumensis]MDR7364416.1 putative phosphomutase (TIGR03848 family) [Nocardioides marmoribigeumensis]
MATVVLLRHGRSTANTAHVLAGRTKGVHLDDTGRGQAERAAERLAGTRVARIVTSPLERCRETARPLARAHPDVPLSSDRGLVEVDYGEWTNRALKDLAKEKLWRVVQAQPSAATFPEGEGLAAMSARVVSAVRRLDAEVEAEHGPGAVWVAVSHGDPIKAVLADALGMHLDAFQRIHVEPASISVVRYTPERPFVLMSNTTAGDLAGLTPPQKKGRTPARRSSDAVVGGGA